MSRDHKGQRHHQPQPQPRIQQSEPEAPKESPKLAPAVQPQSQPQAAPAKPNLTRDALAGFYESKLIAEGKDPEEAKKAAHKLAAEMVKA